MSRSPLVLFLLASSALAQTPVISTIAGATPFGGTPVRGYNGDGDLAANATLALANLQNPCDPQKLEQTSHISFDATGNLYIADSNNQRIRRIGVDGVISTVAGSGERPAIDGRCEATGPIGDGADATSAKLYNPSAAVPHPNGSLIIADQLNNRIRIVSPAGVVSTIAGNGTHNLYAPGIPATASPMDWPSALAVDTAGLVYFAELHGNRVAKIGADGRLVTIAGTGFPGYDSDNIPAVSARLNKPAGIAVDAGGNVYIADMGNHRIRRVTPAGQITTVAGTGVRGSASAQLDSPMDVKVDSAGNIYVADTGNHRIRRIDPQGAVTTVAGTGQPDRGHDLTDATSSALNSPSALAIDQKGDVYVVDWQNYLVRKISFDGKPVLTPQGIVNAASFTEPVAPGSIVAIFGANLAKTTAVATGATWPPAIDDVSVELGGSAIPLYFVSPGQLAGQLPYGLQPGTAKVVAKIGGIVSNTINVNIALQTIGIFSLPGGRAAAQNQDYVLNTPTTPVSRGEPIILYLTGLGEVTPAAPAGQLSPLDLVSRPVANNITATVGGVPSQILYVGLTPGTIGLSQANVRVPDSVAPGSAIPVVIRAEGRVSNAATISVR